MKTTYLLNTILLLSLTGWTPGWVCSQTPTSSPPLFLIQQEDKFGFINSKGKIVVEPRLANAGAFHDGLALAFEKGKWGYIDGTGTFVIEPQFDEAEFWDDQSWGGMLADTILSEDEKIGSRSKPPKIKITLKAFPFAENLALVQQTEKEWANFTKSPQIRYGFIDRTGKFAIPAQFEWAGAFSEGMAAVQTGGKCGFIDPVGKMVIPAQYEAAREFRDGLAPVRVKGFWGYINRQGEMVIPPQFSHAFPFREEVAVVVTRESKSPLFRVVIDKTGKILFANKVLLASSYSEGKIPFRPLGGETKWGYLDKTGKVVIPPQFAFAGAFSHGLARVATKDQELGTGWSYINSKGQIVWPSAGARGKRK